MVWILNDLFLLLKAPFLALNVPRFYLLFCVFIFIYKGEYPVSHVFVFRRRMCVKDESHSVPLGLKNTQLHLESPNNLNNFYYFDQLALLAIVN